MGFVETDMNVFESDGMAKLTVAITLPTGADPIETSFNLLVNTLDGTAMAADLPGLPLLNLYVPIKYSENCHNQPNLSTVNLTDFLHHHFTRWVSSTYHTSLSVVI